MNLLTRIQAFLIVWFLAFFLEWFGVEPASRFVVLLEPVSQGRYFEQLLQSKSCVWFWG